MDKKEIDREFEEFYLQEFNEVLGYLRWRIRDPNLAHDLFHDSIIAIHNQHCKHEKPYTHASLIKIARNKANYYLRQHNTRSNHDQKIKEISEHDVLKHSSPEDKLLDEERAQIAIYALQSLNEREKKCLELRSKGYSYEEVGEELMMKPKTVGAVISRAINKAKGIIQKRFTKKAKCQNYEDQTKQS